MKSRTLTTLVLAALCLISAASCRYTPVSSGSKSGPTVVDAHGKSVTVSDSSRIVAVGTAITETVYALGAGDRLVGVDNSSSEYLSQTSGLAKVGPRTTLSAEGIMSLKPTFLVLTGDAGPGTAVEQISNSGVATLVLPADYTVDAVKAKIRTIAAALDLKPKGEELIAGIDREMADVTATLAPLKEKPKVMFVGRGPNMPNATMSGKGTTIDEMISLAGGINPTADFQGFRTMTDEAVVAAAPDIILMTERSFERSGGIEGVLKFPGVALTPAGKNRRIYTVSDRYFQGFGPEVGKAVRNLAMQLHPQLNGKTGQPATGNQGGKNQA